jgi:type IV pilus assembly protein PilM
MIRNLFLPDRVKGYYLFGTRIIGFDIAKTAVRATQIYCKGKEIVIEKCFEIPIQASTSSTEYQERAAIAIKNILEQARYNIIVSSLSSSQAIFKELKLPFLGLDTIKKVIGFEVEPLLPFSLNDAVIDCIITKENKEEKSSEVLVGAVQNQYVAQHLALFEAAGVQPEQVTIDLFALYGLYKMIPAYANQKGGIVLLEIESQSTRMAYIYDGQLRFIRTLSKGLLDQAKSVSSVLRISEQEALEHIIRYGLESADNEGYIGAIKQAFTTSFNDVMFTLQSFVSQAKPVQSINKIIIFGTSASIKGLPELITDLSHIKCEIFHINTLIHNGFGISAKSSIPQTNIVSLATALPNTSTSTFNLRKREFALSNAQLFMRQFIIAAALAGLIIGSLLGMVIWQIRKLQREVYQSEQEIIGALKEKVKKIPEDVNGLDETIDAAKSEVNREEKMWSAFSSAAHPNFLKYLLELTNKIDKQSLGFELDSLKITADTIVMKASVRDFDELATLRRDLAESKSFEHIERVLDPKNFTMTIRLAKKAARREQA